MRFPRRLKYNAVRVKLDGYTFDSKAEARYYGDLTLQARKGQLLNLKVHPRFEIKLVRQKICDVILDFAFYDKIAGRDRYIDVKGRDNALSRLKRKLVEAFYGIKIEVVKPGRF
jgi:Protein of unknown function (DUF1064)